MTAITTHGLGKRYNEVSAVQDCSIDVPESRVCGLVGSNGAGKTSLLRMLAALTRPTTGTAEVAGRAPADDPAFLRHIGYLAQEVPLYRRWTTRDHLALGARLDPRWDEPTALARLEQLDIPLDRPVGALSGGMRAQVALGLALGKRPDVLMLDEPVAALDPLARREFLGSLAGAVAEGGLTVLMSSHLLADLERVCDHLILMAGGRVALCASIDDLLATHKVVSGPPSALAALRHNHRVIHEVRTPRLATVTVQLNGPLLDPAWQVDEISVEDLVLAYLRGQTGRSPAGTITPASVR